MSQFLYFVPCVPLVNREKLREVGLDYVDDVSGGADIIGPDNIRGCLFAADMTRLAFKRETQTWIGAPKGDADSHPYWLGWDKQSPPATDELQRETLIDGPIVTTVGGHRWQVPRIRDWFPSDSSEQMPVWSTNLPRMVTVDDHGKPMLGEVVRSYRELFDLSMRVFVKRVSGGDELSDADLMQFAADVLAMNYRVSLFELSGLVMDCLSVNDAVQIIDAAIDTDGYLDAVKNSDGRPTPEAIDTDSGSGRPTQEDETTTDQRLAS